MKAKFGIKNFRAFDESGVEVEIAPITLLTGCNSSGKSSVTKGFVIYNSVLSNLKLSKDLFTGMGVFDPEYYSSIGQTYSQNTKLGKIDFSKPVLSTLGNVDMLQNDSSKNEIELSMEVFSYVLNSIVKVVLHISSIENDFARNGHVIAIDFFNIDDNTLIGHLDKDSAKWSVKSIENVFVEQIEYLIQIDPGDIDLPKGMRGKIYGLLVNNVFPHFNTLSESKDLFAQYTQSRLMYSSSLLDSIGDCTPDSFLNHMKKLFHDKEIELYNPYIEYIDQNFRQSGYSSFMDYYKYIYSLWISSMRSVEDYTFSYDSCSTFLDCWWGRKDKSKTEERYSLQCFTIISRMYSNGDEVVDIIPELLKDFMSLLVEEITTVSRLDYVSSSRATIKRSYPRDINDEFTTLISEYFDARFSASRKNNRPDVYMNSFIDHWLNEFKIGKSFHPTNSEDGSSFIIRILKHDGTERLLADEGYGVTQFISILLQIETEALKYKTFADNPEAPFQATIVVEEPEIHLHPRYQSLLAEMFLDAYKKYHIHFIIETHSEYIIRRFQTLVAYKELAPTDISISYLADEEHVAAGEPKVKQIGIKEDGFLSDSFGSGFFDEGSRWSKELIDKKFA